MAIEIDLPTQGEVGWTDKLNTAVQRVVTFANALEGLINSLESELNIDLSNFREQLGELDNVKADEEMMMQQITSLQSRVSLTEQNAVTVNFKSVGVPAMTVVLTSITQDITVTWDTPFVDTNYVITPPQVISAAVTLLGKTSAVVKSKTTTSAVITVTTTGSIALGQATLQVFAYRRLNT